MGEKRSLTISEGVLLKLTTADHNRTLTDGTGLSGKVHAGARGIGVHFRYRSDGEQREMALGAWPRDTLDSIRAKFEETKLRVERGGDPVGQKKRVTQQIALEQTQLSLKQQELLQQQREHDAQRLTMAAMFEAWFPEAMADVRPRGAHAIR